MAENRDTTCRVTDSLEQLVEKLEIILQNRNKYTDAASTVALGSSHKLRRNEREFMTVVVPLGMETAECIAELYMPRCLVDSANAMHARALIEASLVSGRPENKHIGYVYESPQLKPGTEILSVRELPELARKHVSDDAIRQLIAANPTYARLHELWKSLDSIIDDAFTTTQISCAYKCGKFGARKKCGACSKYFCSDACQDEHRCIT